MNRLLFQIIFLFFTANVFSQSKGTALIITDTDANISIDGEAKEAISSNVPKKYSLTVGEHLIQIEANINGETAKKSQVAVIEAEKQKVIEIQFSGTEQKPVQIVTPVEGAITTDITGE